MTASIPLSQQLQEGSALQFWARRGSCVQLAAGKAYLMEPPLWLAETMLQEPHLLLGGSSHIVSSSGWVVIHAISPCELRLAMAPVMPTPIRRLLGWAGSHLADCLVRAGQALGQWAGTQMAAKI